MPPPPVTPPTMPEPLLLNKKQVAEMLSIGVSTLERYCSLHWIPRPRKIGNTIRWSADELREWIADGCKRPAN